MKDAFYDQLHINKKDAMKRFFNNEPLYLDMLKLFQDDPSFSQLEEALAAGDIQNAFMAAHTLKGVAANLSLSKLFELDFALVEDLRSGAFDAAQKRFPEVKKEYQIIIDGILHI